MTKSYLKNLHHLLMVSILVFGFCAIIGSGGGDSDEEPAGESVIPVNMDISGAKMLLFLKSDAQQSSQEVRTANAASGEEVLIYKLTNDGLLIEVKYYDDGGNEISSTQILPTTISPVTSDYIYVQFPAHRFELQHYFVRKSDGAVLRAPRGTKHKLIPPFIDFLIFYTKETTSMIGDGNIYYYPWADPYGSKLGSLNKIDISDPDLVIDTQVSPTSDDLRHPPILPLVDKSGNIFYIANSGGDRVVRLVRPSGSVTEISDSFPEGHNNEYPGGIFSFKGQVFLSPGNDICFLYSHNTHSNIDGYYWDTYVYKFIIDDEDKKTDDSKTSGNQSGVHLELIGTLSLEYEGHDKDYSTFYHTNGSAHIKYLNIGNKTIAVQFSSSVSGVVAEVYNPEGDLRAIDRLLYKALDVQAGENFYFLFGKISEDGDRALYRVNAATHEYSDISLESSVYELYKIKVISDNEVIFYALRYSDGADIVGSINQNGEVTIIKEIVGHPAVELVRVH